MNDFNVMRRKNFGLRCFIVLGVLFCSTSFMVFEFPAQDQLTPKLYGAWVLDSVQVKEIISGQVTNMTVPSDGQAKFYEQWMRRFKLDATGKASYSENNHRLVANTPYYIIDVPYKVEDAVDNTATLIIDGVPDYKILKLHLISDNRLIIKYSFNSSYDLQDIEVSWIMFYHKSNQ